MDRYLYLHGFASSAASRKGVYLRNALAGDGIRLELLDLNVPSFERQTYTAVLALIDDHAASGPPGPLRLLGSSMGGYLAARWAELNPERVERMFLLCPGFDLASRWPLLIGAEETERWEREGSFEIEDATGRKRPLHWEFVADARRHPAYPEVPCRTRIFHGTRDAVVPIELSRRYVAGRPHVDLVEVDDEHGLADSLDRLVTEARGFFAD